MDSTDCDPPDHGDPPGQRATALRAPRALPAMIVAAMLAAGAAPAWARSEKTLAYAREQAWPAAVRFLAVDAHARITEKDADAGYVMFELRDEGRVFRGSLEVVPVVRDGRTVVRFVMQIADRPSWLELVLLDRLEDKLRAELGSPSPSPPPSQPQPQPRPSEPGKDSGKDGGKDAGKDGGKDDGKRDGKPDDGPPVSPNP
jgi:hypothetical protein